VIIRLAALAVAWVALTGATPLPLAPPPPDLAGLVPYAAAPLEKPALTTALPPLPAPPAELPAVRPAVVVVPSAEKPTAELPPPGTAPCFWAWLPSAGESLKCGMGRLYRGEHEKAREALEQAVRSGSERELIAEARYWLAETHWILGRPELADGLFRQVAQEPQQPLAVWALFGSGWTALRAGDAARARDTFARLAGSPLPAALDGWSRHGLALSLYALGRYDEAERAWADLRTRTVPAPLSRDVLFWHGESLGRTGRHAQAEAELKRFTAGGQHALLDTGLLRQGWWALADGRANEAVAPLRAVLSMPVRATSPNAALERDWADAGLALALLNAGEMDGVRRSTDALRARKSPLLVPVLFRLAAGAVGAKQPAEAQQLVQEVLGARLDPPARAWALLVAGDALHAQGNRDDARTQYDLARQADPNGLIGRHAALRSARVNFEHREFAQAAADVAPLLGSAIPAELRSAALLMRGEASYHAGDYTTAADAFRRALVESPQAADNAGVRLALGWTALRQGRQEEARRHFTDFVKAQPDHPRAGDALLLASELALTAGDIEEGRALLDRMLTTYAAHPRIEFAKLNRALLLLRTGQASAAEPTLREWVARAPFPPLVPRVQAALGTALLANNKTPEAVKAFADAARGGENAIATLGVASAALASGRLDEATKTFTEARDRGTPAVKSAAEYGLAVVAYHRGDPKVFVPVARTALASATPMQAPVLLYVLTGLAADAREWPEALQSAKRLVAEYPTHETADDALERVGSTAAAARAWPVVQESYGLLAQRYPKSPFAEGATVALAEAQIATGRGPEAIAALERFVNANPTNPASARAWVAIGRARESAGLTSAAMEAYGAALRGARDPAVRHEALSAHARLLLVEKKWAEARALLQPMLGDRDPAVAAEAAQAIGETYRGEGDALTAAEYFMTAAYAAPDSPAGRKAMLAAAQTYAAAKQPDAAAIVYRKLLAQSNVPTDVVEAARQGLASLSTR
jgi:tetratricopeptide (TPR) repeat protein